MERTTKLHESRLTEQKDALAALKAELDEERRQRKMDSERWQTELAFKVRLLHVFFAYIDE